MLLAELVTTCTELFQEGRYTAARAACDRALAGDLSPEERCKVLQLKSRAIMAEDKRWKGPAMGCLVEALELTAPNTVLRGQVLAAFTAGHASIHSLGLCKQARDEFAQVLTATGAPELARLFPDVEFNLALTFHELERLDDAETAYMKALDEASRMKDDPYVAALIPMIQLNLVDIFLRLDREEHAAALLHKCGQSLPDDQFGAHIRNQRAVHALVTGDLVSAVLWVESGLGHRSCDTKTRAALVLTKARIAEAHGQMDEAHDYAQDALRLAAIACSSRLCYRASLFMNQLSRGV